MSEADFLLGEWRIRPGHNTIDRGGKSTRLEARLMRVLCCLARHGSEAVSKDTLVKEVWNQRFASDEVVAKSISELRRVFEDDARQPRMVQTIPKVGYRLLAAAVWLRAPRPPTKVMLAVLPFENLGPERDKEYVSDGMTEEIIAGLGRLQPEKLGVIARTTAMIYKRSGKTIKKIAEELGVEFVLEGSVRMAGLRTRVTAQLIAANDETHVWAETYERDSSDVLAVQREIAARVAREIQRGLLRDMRVEKQPVNPAAHDFYLKGRFFWNKRTAGDLALAVNYFRKAVECEPTYAVARCGLADAYNMLGYWLAAPPGEVFPLAKAEARRALEIDPDLAEAHASLAYAQFEYDWNWRAAGERYRRALELNANCVVARQWYAEYLGLTGQMAALDEQLKLALTLDPLSLPLAMVQASVSYMLRRYEESLQKLRSILQMDENFVLAHFLTGAVHSRLAQNEEAVAAWARGLLLSGYPKESLSVLRRAFEKKGIKGYWQAELEILQRQAQEQYVSPILIAMDAAQLGKTDEALRWLEAACKERCGWLLELHIDPVWDPIRGHSRFKKLLRQIGLP